MTRQWEKCSESPEPLVDQQFVNKLVEFFLHGDFSRLGDDSLQILVEQCLDRLPSKTRQALLQDYFVQDVLSESEGPRPNYPKYEEDDDT